MLPCVRFDKPYGSHIDPLKGMCVPNTMCVSLDRWIAASSWHRQGRSDPVSADPVSGVQRLTTA